MKRWEYLIVTGRYEREGFGHPFKVTFFPAQTHEPEPAENMATLLNRLGREGWELVQCGAGSPLEREYVLKRELAPKEQS